MGYPFWTALPGPLVASVLGGALHWIESLFAQHGYLIIAALIGGESAGLPLPGETSLLAGAVEAQRGVLYLPWVMAVAAAAAMVGDNLGYLIGSRAGRPALLRYGRFFHIRERQLLVLDYYFARHGAKTVFFGRWITILRVGAALFAGASSMPWRSFLLWNALGSVAWAVSVSLLGFFFAASVGAVRGVFGYLGIVAFFAAFVVMFLILRRISRQVYQRVAQEDEQARRLADGAGNDEAA
jgi:membrane protein DedA with SNARE-associated domain